MELPVDRQEDPRARRYIIDHLAPGAVIERKIEITNRTAKRKQVDLYAAAASIEGGQFRFADGRSANELSSWTTLSRPVLDLRAGEKKQATARIRVPEKAPAGERYAVIWASTASEPKPNAVAKINRVGIRVYLDVGPGGEPPTDFKIKDFVAARAPDGQPSLTVTVTNTGGRAVDLSGTLWLNDEAGEIRAGPFAVIDGTTLAAGHTGTVALAINRRLDNGPWKAELTLTSGLVHRTATTTITFPDPGQPPSTFELGDMSMLLAGSAAVGLGILGVLFVLVRRSRQRTPVATGGHA
ncbi:hypothetical protein [Micromonospora sp. CPCC 205561]|uniref:hypothetical protein n=1 Tax=Micromonospora sp. CPCC 205561 TaxID=3122407 RepID=UPI002FEF8A07